MIESSPEGIKQKRKRLGEYIHLISIPAGICLLLTVVVSVVGRLVFDWGTPWLFPLESLLLVVIVAASIAETYRGGSLVSVTTLVARFKPRTQLIVDIAGLVLAVLCCALIIWLSTSVALRAFATSETPTDMNIPVWPWMMAIPVGFLTLAVEIIVDLGTHIRKLTSKEVSR